MWRAISKPGLLFATLTAMCLLASPTTLAQNPPNWIGGSSGQLPPPELKEVKLTEHAGAMLPLDLTFKDDEGQLVQLRKYFNGQKPVVLQIGYFGCPMLCGLVSEGVSKALKEMHLTAGKDFDFVYISIDPTEKPELAAKKKAAYVDALGSPESAAGVHLLTGPADVSATLAEVVGFGYKWIASAGQYAHPAAIMIVMPDGKVSRYLYGVQFDPQTVRMSLVEASNGKIGTTTDQFFLTCFQYDGKQGKYAMTALTIMRSGGVLMMLIVATSLTIMFRREWKIEAQRRAVEGSAFPVTQRDGGSNTTH